MLARAGPWGPDHAEGAAADRRALAVIGSKRNIALAPGVVNDLTAGRVQAGRTTRYAGSWHG